MGPRAVFATPLGLRSPEQLARQHPIAFSEYVGGWFTNAVTIGAVWFVADGVLHQIQRDSVVAYAEAVGWVTDSALDGPGRYIMYGPDDPYAGELLPSFPATVLGVETGVQTSVVTIGTGSALQGPWVELVERRREVTTLLNLVDGQRYAIPGGSRAYGGFDPIDDQTVLLLGRRGSPNEVWTPSLGTLVEMSPDAVGTWRDDGILAYDGALLLYAFDGGPPTDLAPGLPRLVGSLEYLERGAVVGVDTAGRLLHFDTNTGETTIVDTGVTEYLPRYRRKADDDGALYVVVPGRRGGLWSAPLPGSASD